MENKISTEELDSIFIEEKIDLFINCISFEERCTKISLSFSPGKIANVLCFINKVSDFDKEAKEKNRNLLLSHFPDMHVIILDKADPINTARNIFSSIQDRLLPMKETSIVVDITTFTHESLLILFKILLGLNDNIKCCRFLYNPAIEYAPDIVDHEQKWLSKGIKEIRTVLGFPGNFDPLKKFHLLLLAGIEYERASKLIEEFEPSRISIGLPYEEDSPAAKSYDLNLSKYKKLLSIYSNDSVHYFKFSAYNPEVTKDLINKHMINFTSYNNVIAPLNNKLSTVGVGLYCFEHPEIQICYPIPEIHNLIYSTPSDDIYIYQLL